MSDEPNVPVRSTVMEVAELKSKKRRGSLIIVAIIVLSAVAIGVAYWVLKPAPCELVTDDMCGFADMTGDQCPTLEKAMTDMGADEAWCENIIKGRDGLEPDQFSGHYLSALRTLLDADIERHEKAGRPVPAGLAAVQDKVDPSAAAKRRLAAEAPAKAPPPPPAPATDGGASADGSADGGGD